MSLARDLLLPCLLALGLTGCGFQLRGQAQVPGALQPLAVQCATDVPRELCQTLKEELELRDVRLAEPENAAHVLRLDGFGEKRRASAITPEASAAEYDLRQSLSLSVISADKRPLIAGAEVTASDTYRYDETNVLAKRREEESIRSGLYRHLADQVIFRLAPLTAERIESLREAAGADQDEAQ